MRNTLLVLLVLLFSVLAANVHGEDPVVFVDNDLKLAVQAALGIVDPTASDMATLEFLDARSRQIDDISGIEYAVGLKTLYLFNNSIDDITELSALTNLEVLALSDNLISDLSPLSLLNIIQLGLSGNSVDDLSSLAGMTSLQGLWVQGNSVSDISHVSGMSNLSILNINNNQVTDLTPLVDMNSLNAVAAEGNTLNTNQCCTVIPAIEANNPMVYGLYYDYDANPITEDCLTDLSDFAMLASQWLNIGCSSGDGYCDGADLDDNGEVDITDLNELAGLWHMINNPIIVLDIDNGSDISGRVYVELYPEDAPVTVANILNYVDSGFYDGLIFHREIMSFMIQGGGYTSLGAYKTPIYDPIVNEASNGLKNLRGTIAMARTADPDSATSQFFINHIDNPHLDWTISSAGYCVFGKVIAGMNIVDRIAATNVSSSEPVVTVLINSISRK